MRLYAESVINSLQWCQDNGELLIETKGYSNIDLSEIDSNKILVCLVDNGPFMTGNVAFNLDEFNCFDIPDGRNKYWFKFKDVVLEPVCPQWDSYLGDD